MSAMAAKIIGTAFFTPTEGPLLIRWTSSAEQLKWGSRRPQKVVEPGFHLEKSVWGGSSGKCRAKCFEVNKFPGRGVAYSSI